jgi:DNA-binding ferritin-like protein
MPIRSLSDRSRRRSAAILQARLCDTLDLELQFRQVQWSFKGSDIRTLCPLFRTLAIEAGDIADLIAGGIRRLMETPDLRPETVSRLTALLPFTLDASPERHLRMVATALVHLAKLIQASAEAAQALGDLESFDLLHDLSDQIDRQIQTLRQRLEDTVLPAASIISVH